MKEMKLLSTRQAADILRVKPRTVARWCREEQITAVKLGRVWRVPLGTVRDIVLRGK